ncbi:hypothetical protein ABK905_20620 [Acerihabitans sp. KWT182]|uniref:Uncharacterized protein n=1 Tax=Acerihabitans sp. KWT182 TaxID=3157919 RepID=A0AAU7Q6W1_9GAMM
MSRLILENPHSSAGWHGHQIRVCEVRVIDVKRELEEFESQFVKIMDVIQEVKTYTQVSDDTLVAKWILKRISDYNKPFPSIYRINKFYEFEYVFSGYGKDPDLDAFRDILSDIIKHKTLPSYDEPPFEDSDWNSKLAFDAGFKREDISDVFPFLTTSPVSSLAQGNINDLDVLKCETPLDWREFPGKATALMFIAGLATALESTGGKYSRGGKINKSAIADAAVQAINKHGKGTDISSRALTELIKAALDANLPDRASTSKS